ncbi:hypothetical protein C8Q80DRAFT_49444 [Daedaleopsis nitida]|nr:hypothetical protein C8Q80DRAFT_49444 [Daedaleopsis nitida]
MEKTVHPTPGGRGSRAGLHILSRRLILMHTAVRALPWNGKQLTFRNRNTDVGVLPTRFDHSASGLRHHQQSPTVRVPAGSRCSRYRHGRHIVARRAVDQQAQREPARLGEHRVNVTSISEPDHQQPLRARRREIDECNKPHAYRFQTHRIRNDRTQLQRQTQRAHMLGCLDVFADVACTCALGTIRHGVPLSNNRLGYINTADLPCPNTMLDAWSRPASYIHPRTRVG